MRTISEGFWSLLHANSLSRELFNDSLQWVRGNTLKFYNNSQANTLI